MPLSAQFVSLLSNPESIQTFLNNPQTQDLLGKVKNTKIGDIKNLKKDVKNFAKGQAVQNLKTNAINTLANKANMGVNKIFDNLKKF